MPAANRSFTLAMSPTASKWVVGLALLCTAPLVRAQTPSVEEIANVVKATRGQIQSLSHRYTRTYTPGDGKRVEGLFAINATDDRRMDLGMTSGAKGDRTSKFNLKG